MACHTCANQAAGDAQVPRAHQAELGEQDQQRPAAHSVHGEPQLHMSSLGQLLWACATYADDNAVAYPLSTECRLCVTARRQPFRSQDVMPHPLITTPAHPSSPTSCICCIRSAGNWFKDELAKSVTTEQGKTFQDAKGDVFRGLGKSCYWRNSWYKLH
jgi:hypothetical protein